MQNLHLTRVAFGAPDLPTFLANVAARAQGGEVRFTTRNRPRRADELVGGYIHFIIRHTLVARSEILRFDTAAEGRTDIVCTARIEPIHPTPRRAHQGWRYLEAADAPALLGGDGEIGEMPPELLRELSLLALI
jgi:hypothetical protein